MKESKEEEEKEEEKDWSEEEIDKGKLLDRED